MLIGLLEWDGPLSNNKDVVCHGDDNLKSKQTSKDGESCSCYLRYHKRVLHVFS